jgi:hypothetical protein
MNHLEKAIANPDSETSHYAASAVMDIQRKLLNSLQEFSVKYESDKTNPEIIVPYLDVLKSYLSSGLLDEKSRFRYRSLYSEVLESSLAIMPKKEYFVAKIECDLELKDYLKAEQFCKAFLERFPDIEEPYLMLLSYYYQKTDGAGFKETMAALKSSKVKFSSKALEIVRYWGRIA